MEREPQLVEHACSNKVSRQQLHTEYGVRAIRPNDDGKYFLGDLDVTDGDCPICRAKVKTFNAEKTLVNSAAETGKRWSAQRKKSRS